MHKERFSVDSNGLGTLLRPAWDDICERCGLCCFEKSYDRQGRLRISRTPCRHLDIITRECRVDAKRLTVDEGCVQLTPEIVRAADWLPTGCAYRRITQQQPTDED